MLPRKIPTRLCRRRAFSIIELLAVIAIVGVLAATLVSVLSRMSASAKSAKCLSNLRQIGMIFHSYVVDNDGEMPFTIAPGEGSWDYKLVSYSSSPANARAVGEAAGMPYGVFACPSSEKPVRTNAVASSYAINQNLVGIHNTGTIPSPTPMRITNVTRPSQTYLITDSDAREFRNVESSRAAFSQVRFGGVSPINRHMGKLNMLFVDGSVSVLTLDEMAWGSDYPTSMAPWGPQ